MNCEGWGAWTVEFVEVSTGKGLRAGGSPMFAEHGFALRFLVFVEWRGESGLWLADRIGLGHERRLNAVAHHTERLMRIDRRMNRHDAIQRNPSNNIAAGWRGRRY